MLPRRRGNRIILFSGQKTTCQGEFKAGVLSLLLKMLNNNSAFPLKDKPRTTDFHSSRGNAHSTKPAHQGESEPDYTRCGERGGISEFCTKQVCGQINVAAGRNNLINHASRDAYATWRKQGAFLTKMKLLPL